MALKRIYSKKSRWFRESAGIVLLMFGVFLILALVTYSPDDPSDNTIFAGGDNPPVTNLMGIFGARAADWAIRILGSVAFGLPAVILWFGMVLVISRRSGFRILKGLFISVSLLVAVATIMAIFPAGGLSDPILRLLYPHHVLSAGGAIGTLMSQPVITYLGRWGGFLMMITVLFVLVVAGTGISLGDFLIRSGDGLADVLRRGPKWKVALAAVVRIFGEKVGSAIRGAGALIGGVVSRKEPVPDSTPVPKRTSPRAKPETSPPPAEKIPIIGLHRKVGTADIRQEPLALAPKIDGFTLPPLTLLDPPPPSTGGESRGEILSKSQMLVRKLEDFQIEGEVVKVHPGPVVTLFEFKPAPGIKLNRIVNLADDLSLALSARSIRIIAPIPGKSVVGIEVSNNRREVVSLREVLESDKFSKTDKKLPIALGKDIFGIPFVSDLASMPHLLIAGATGSGKSVLINSLICSLLFQFPPDRVKVLMIDPKMVELSLYDRIPHQICPVVTHPKQASAALKNVIGIMDDRYRLIADHGVRNLESYNDQVDAGEIEGDRVPYLLVIIDELADLMVVAGNQVEDSIMRLAQMARAVGIHLVLATQRPSVNVITGVIKANLPARISFQVSSKTDSRTILDANGAEQLLGKGDMLFLLPGTSVPVRVHGCLVSEHEVRKVVSFWRDQAKPDYDLDITRDREEEIETEGDDIDDDLYREAISLVVKTGQASISMVQRKLRVGYNRAARMVEKMEKDGIVSPPDGVRPRKVLKTSLKGLDEE